MHESETPDAVEDGDAAYGEDVAGDAVSDESAGDAEATERGDVSPREKAELASVSYPTAWLAVPVEGVPAGVAVSVRSLPAFDVSAHRDGEPVSSDEQAELRSDLPEASDGCALVCFEGETYQVDANLLLVNLPDVLDRASYDIVYAYASTSNCAGIEIPGVTGCRLEGYADGRQPNAYLARDEFAVPCAYGTACKLQAVCDELALHDLQLLVYDAYRPMRAQWQLSDALSQAYAQDPAIAASMGEWSMGWYVATGPSGHNFGTDVDVGVCDLQGNPLPMPSSFDAFDASGHLTSVPIDSASITPDAYCEAVAGNEACMAMHAAFRAAGFTELASEWWHFGDGETESAMRAAAGDGGLDFTATLE